MLLNHLFDRHVVFFAGKGGVGKTTCSAAFALAASRLGRRVLLVSTDPAHSISTIVATRVGGSVCEIGPRLWALEIDGARESVRYVESVKSQIERIFSPDIIRQAHRQIDMAAASPGVSEVAVLDRMMDLITDGRHRYELIVFDTAPTGHTLQLLRVPESMTTWVQALVKHRRALLDIDRGEDGPRVAPETDPVLTTLERRHARLTELVECLRDRGRTTFVLVTVPERLPLEETSRAAAQLADARFDIGGLIVNRVLPDGLAGDFYASRKRQEDFYLDEITRRFAGTPRVGVRLLPRDVSGFDMLGRIAEQLIGPS